ncbi:hypothetical protein Tco_0503224 [Tanacetum coccineum]
MEDVSLLTQKHLFITTTDTDKHEVPPTKRLFKVAMLDPSPNLLVHGERLEIRDNLEIVPYGKTWVTVNGPLRGFLKLARENLQSRVKEEDSITDVENAIFDLGCSVLELRTLSCWHSELVGNACSFVALELPQLQFLNRKGSSQNLPKSENRWGSIIMKSNTVHKSLERKVSVNFFVLELHFGEGSQVWSDDRRQDFSAPFCLVFTSNSWSKWFPPV